MQYVSTRGKAPALSFDDVLLTGLARDGGLYLPESWPQFSADDIRDMRGLSYADMAVRVMYPFVEGSIAHADFNELVQGAYKDFGHPAVAPLKQLDSDQWVMELFHGPTLAFKDYALQLLGRLFDYVLKKRGERVTIVGATSGDTGSAAIEACRDRECIDIFIMHPKGRVSDVQRRQMTTILSSNVHNIALEGTFDDCQDAVKAMFNDMDFRDKYNLSAVNSINWARIMAQIAYYFWAAVQVGAPDRKTRFAVPTGNFGNVFAGYCAKKMGLPIESFVIGSNRNDILTRYFKTGVMKMETVEPSLSPSMDIQISSNFERLLAQHYKADGSALAQALADFRDTGEVDFGADRWKAMCEDFTAQCLNDEETKQAINAFYQQTGELLDPHSVIGCAVARDAVKTDAVTIALATAHPAKFPAAVEEASGVHPALPERLSDLFDREERFDVLENDLPTIQSYIEKTLA
ncbi:threonine synthase [Terasakiella brassicae]|uniref:Threonine synthase n=1 Tax=Terasakiella brassicae TaxID=1634917 RepID=A0A917C350_9PROT|nr:threonine synthase [Terasakiella brassicae]GGF69493.1 threonine synthase [Terasakiella brassicae]